MSKTLTTAEINHLRRLIAWLDCEVGPSPEEQIATARAIAPAVGEVSEEGKQRLQESLEKAARVPKYVRQALKVLRAAAAPAPGEIVDAESVHHQPELPSPKTALPAKGKGQS